LLVSTILDILPGMLVLFSIAFAAYALIVLWLLQGLIRLPHAKEGASLPGVTVIVAARDESAHLKDCLDALARQEYAGEWEVWIIDDQSRDETLAIARKAALDHPNWHATENDHTETWHSSKKGALETAIRRARGELLLLTDADCTPPALWISGMVAALSPQIGFSAGFAPLRAPAAPVWWQEFLRVDALAAAMVAAGGIGHGCGITCAGRSLACRRSALEEIGGYAGLPDTFSGDDDFLLQAIARCKKWRMAYALEPQIAVPSLGPPDWRAFLLQKKRHLSAGTSYNRPAQAGYLIFHAANGLLWLAALFSPLFNPAWALLLLLKVVLDGITLIFWSNKLRQPFPLAGFFAWEFLFPLYHLLAFPRPGRETPWKN
jgi:poly-beta-1,6-N-acetyl-D-glucosamine synthase